MKFFGKILFSGRLLWPCWRFSLSLVRFPPCWPQNERDRPPQPKPINVLVYDEWLFGAPKDNTKSSIWTGCYTQNIFFIFFLKIKRNFSPIVDTMFSIWKTPWHYYLTLPIVWANSFLKFFFRFYQQQTTRTTRREEKHLLTRLTAVDETSACRRRERGKRKKREEPHKKSRPYISIYMTRPRQTNH